MKITIKTDDEDSRFEPEMNVFLTESSQRINLMACDANNNEWIILWIDKQTGLIHREGNIDYSTEWPLDTDGYLKLDTE